MFKFGFNGLSFRGQGLGFRVYRLGFRVRGAGLLVRAFRVCCGLWVLDLRMLRPTEDFGDGGSYPKPQALNPVYGFRSQGFVVFKGVLGHFQVGSYRCRRSIYHREAL